MTNPAPATWYDWAAPRPWTCPRCGCETETREAAPRCPHCSLVDSGD